jgi:hypothetical protein
VLYFIEYCVKESTISDYGGADELRERLDLIESMIAKEGEPLHTGDLYLFCGVWPFMSLSVGTPWTITIVGPGQ